MNDIFITMPLTKLKNEVHVQFNESVNTLVLSIGVEFLGLTALHPHFVVALGNEKQALDYMRQSKLTIQIDEQDLFRNKIFRGLSDTIKGLTNHYDAEARECGAQLWRVFKFYGNLTEKPLDAKTAAINDLLRELMNEENEPLMEMAGFTDWADELQSENDKFHKLMMQRYGETTVKTPFRMKTARKETDRYYRAMISDVENAIIKNVTRNDMSGFVVGMNAITTRYKSILAQEINKSKNEGNTKPTEPADD